MNEKEELLLVKNPRKGWEYPGGMIEPGETLVQGLLREIREESGVTAEVLRAVGIYSNTKPRPGYNGVLEIPTTVIVDFICRYRSGALRTSEESTEVRWVSKERALELVNAKLQYRLRKALDFQSGFTCAGFFVNADDAVEIHEEYRFPR